MNFLLHHMIDVSAERAPHHEAVRCRGQVLDYAGLARRSDQLAGVLRECGVARRDRVGIHMDKCAETAVALYGIMKAGGAYVPLDPSAPVERLAAIMRDCGIAHLITADNKAGKLREVAERGVALATCVGASADAGVPARCIAWDEVWAAPALAPPAKVLAQDLAYIIYTSGSTGEPKGIMHTHASGLSFARWASSEYALRAEDRLANHAPLHFDLSIFDYFAAAAAGATTVIVPEEYTRLPASYSQLLADERVSVLFTVPFALIQLLLRGLLDQRDLGALRWVIFGGEPFQAKHLHELMQRLPQARFDNMYGPAEVNGCTHYTVPALRGDEASIPIGPICDIAEALVVDGDDQPVTRGEAGELLVRTPTMMQGYWGRPDLNRAAFLRREELPQYHTLYYRTGDLVREDGEGVFSFLGRKDRQIKVRGYRIELDEVEAALAAHEAVEEAAAFPVPDAEGSQQIRAAVTVKAGHELSDAALLNFVRERLPWYAIPGRLALRDGFPRTTTGKIDRRRLRSEALEAAAGP